MYWILLSIGAINSFIPIAIILVFIAAAAGATRGYSLLSLFGISTLIGAGSGGKKGSMAGKSGYSSFMRSASRYPSNYGVSINTKKNKYTGRPSGLYPYLKTKFKKKQSTYNMPSAPVAGAGATTVGGLPQLHQASTATGTVRLATVVGQIKQPRVPPTVPPISTTGKLTPEEEGARLRQRINAPGGGMAGLLGFGVAVAFTGYAFKEFFRAVPMAIPVRTKGGKPTLKVTPQNYGEIVRKQSPRMGYYLNALAREEGPPGRVYHMEELGMAVHPRAELRGRQLRTDNGITRNIIPLGFKGTVADIRSTLGKTAFLIPLGFASGMATMIDIPIRPFVSEKFFERISLAKRVNKAPILRDVLGEGRSPLREKAVDYEEARLKEEKERLESLERANIAKANSSAGKSRDAAMANLLATRTKLGQVKQDLSQIAIFKDNLSNGVTAPIAGVSASTSARVMEAMNKDIPKTSVGIQEARLNKDLSRLNNLEATLKAKGLSITDPPLLNVENRKAQIIQDLNQISLFKSNIAQGTSPLDGVSASTSPRVLEAMKRDMRPKPSPLSHNELEHLVQAKRELTPYEKELLSKHPDPYIRYLLAGNTTAINGNIELQKSLSQDPDTHVQWKIARTADSEEVQRAIAERGDKHSLWSLSQNNSALSHSSVQETLASKGDIYVLTNLAGANISETTQGTLIERSRELEAAAGNNTEKASRAVSIRRELARSENISPNSQDALAVDSDQTVRIELAANAWATSDATNVLTAPSQPEEVRNAAVNNTNIQVHMDAMLNLAKDPSVKIRRTIAGIEAPRITKQHPSLTSGEEAARKAVEASLVYIAENETDRSVLDTLIKNKSRNDRTDAALLRRNIIKKS
jgi:hypothetical protein